MMFWINDKKIEECHEVTVQVRYSDLTLYLNNGQTIQCRIKLEDAQNEIAPYQSFHDWMMGPANSSAFFISTTNGGSYIKRDCLSAYTITGITRNELAP